MRAHCPRGHLEFLFHLQFFSLIYNSFDEIPLVFIYIILLTFNMVGAAIQVL